MTAAGFLPLVHQGVTTFGSSRPNLLAYAGRAIRYFDAMLRYSVEILTVAPFFHLSSKNDEIEAAFTFFWIAEMTLTFPYSRSSMFSTLAPVSRIQSAPVTPTSWTPPAMYSGISWGRRIFTSISESLILGLYVRSWPVMR